MLAAAGLVEELDDVLFNVSADNEYVEAFFAASESEIRRRYRVELNPKASTTMKHPLKLVIAIRAAKLAGSRSEASIPIER
jgi:hypothetical protein